MIINNKTNTITAAIVLSNSIGGSSNSVSGTNVAVGTSNYVYGGSFNTIVGYSSSISSGGSVNYNVNIGFANGTVTGDYNVVVGTQVQYYDYAYTASRTIVGALNSYNIYDQTYGIISVQSNGLPVSEIRTASSTYTPRVINHQWFIEMANSDIFDCEAYEAPQPGQFIGTEVKVVYRINNITTNLHAYRALFDCDQSGVLTLINSVDAGSVIGDGSATVAFLVSNNKVAIRLTNSTGYRIEANVHLTIQTTVEAIPIITGGS